MSKEKSGGLFGDIDKIDDRPDWDTVENTFKNKTKYKVQTIDELREIADAVKDDLGTSLHKAIYVLGPAIDGPGAYEHEAFIHILEEFFKNLERARFIENLSFSIIQERYDDSSGGFDICQASFSFKRDILKKGIEMVRGKLIAENSTKRDFVPALYKFPHKLRRGTRWESITIEFLTPERVRIHVAKYSHETDFKQMGFENVKTGEPNTKWVFLQALAKNSGALTWANGGSNKGKKLIQLLSDDLSDYFSIDFPLFNPYSKKEGYQIKITTFGTKEFLDKFNPYVSHSKNDDEPVEFQDDWDADDPVEEF
jgi:hypothetical protein